MKFKVCTHHPKDADNWDVIEHGSFDDYDSARVVAEKLYEAKGHLTQIEVGNDWVWNNADGKNDEWDDAADMDDPLTEDHHA